MFSYLQDYYQLSIKMGNNLCQNEQTLTLNINNNPTITQQQQIKSIEPIPKHYTQPIEEQSCDDDQISPLSSFINKYQHSKPICASNNLLRRQQTRVLKPIIQKQQFSMRRSRAKKSGRFSVQQGEVSVSSIFKEFLTTEKSMYQPFDRIEIRQEKFIQLRSQSITKYYKFEQAVGEGSFGSVYRAVCVGSRQERAVKVIKKANLCKDRRVQVFAQLQLLKKIDHPNIIRLYQVFENRTKYFVVMEYCRGGSIIQFMKERANFDQGIVRVILKQLLGCVNYLHTLGIVHRDIKLENVVFISKGGSEDELQIKLIDFGTAYKMDRPKVKCTQLIGTLSYIAPEIINGFFTTKCDLWGCGVLLYILLTSRSPFKCKKKQDTIRRIQLHNIDVDNQIPPGVSAPAKKLLLKLLEKDPFKRLSASEALKHEWFIVGRVQGCSQQGLGQGSELMRRISSYYRENNFISVLESYLIFSRVNQPDRLRISSIFKELDANSDGFIQRDELIQAYREASNDPDIDQIEYSLYKIDKDLSGNISLNEFTSVMVNRDQLFVKDALDSAFDYFSNGSPYIDASQLRDLLQGSNSEQIQELLTQLDQNRDRKVSKDEFMNYLTRKGYAY